LVGDKAANKWKWTTILPLKSGIFEMGWAVELVAWMPKILDG